MAANDLIASHLQEHFLYEAETGMLKCIKRLPKSRHQIGEYVGYKDKEGYIRINFFGKCFYMHRLAYLCHYGNLPTNPIDHINGDKTDNRIENLRVSDANSNIQNQRKAHKSNKSCGTIGVSKVKDKYQARIYFAGKLHHIGVFESLEEASNAYIHEKRIHHKGCTL
jgi:HNH endonuclease